jgi:hypothetical protein
MFFIFNVFPYKNHIISLLSVHTATTLQSCGGECILFGVCFKKQFQFQYSNSGDQLISLPQLNSATNSPNPLIAHDLLTSTNKTAAVVLLMERLASVPTLPWPGGTIYYDMSQNQSLVTVSDRMALMKYMQVVHQKTPCIKWGEIYCFLNVKVFLLDGNE